MVEFFKKIDKNTHSDVFDSSVSSFYSDLSEKGTTLTVRSGVYNDLALFDFPVPHPPSYGDGKLIGFDFRFVMSDSDVTNKVNYQGEHHIYLFKENKNMGDEEGTVNPVVDVKVISVAEPLLPCASSAKAPFKVVSVGGTTLPPKVFVPHP